MTDTYHLFSDAFVALDFPQRPAREWKIRPVVRVETPDGRAIVCSRSNAAALSRQLFAIAGEVEGGYWDISLGRDIVARTLRRAAREIKQEDIDRVLSEKYKSRDEFADPWDFVHDPNHPQRAAIDAA